MFFGGELRKLFNQYDFNNQLCTFTITIIIIITTTIDDILRPTIQGASVVETTNVLHTLEQVVRDFVVQILTYAASACLSDVAWKRGELETLSGIRNNQCM